MTNEPNRQPSDWTAEEFHAVFGGDDPNTGQPQDLTEGIRKVIASAADAFYAACRDDKIADANGDLMLRSYYRGRAIQAQTLADQLTELVGDAPCDWDAMRDLATGEPQPEPQP